MDFRKTEDEVLDFWEKNEIYRKSVEKNKSGEKFYFADGPPYANGHIHMGTALNKILKDISMRVRRLKGYDVFDRPGYDTHGLPIEFQVEKEIGSKTKQDIEEYGIGKFVEKCKEHATKYIDIMNDEFTNLGVWMDWKDPYLTFKDDYIEAVWDVLKKTYDKGLLYLGKYSVHVCPRCETAVAFNEIEYAKREDTSIYVKFHVKGKENTFLVIWTTTPWTLPANTGIMVHPDFIYQEIELSSGEKWIIAKDRVQELMATIETGFTVVNEFEGKKMKGYEYENPLSKHLKLDLKNSYRVVLSGRYVTTDEGSGLVHCAPGHGKEDYEVGKENGLDMVSPIKLNGEFTEEGGKYEGKKAKEVDSEIIEDLEKEGALVYKHKYIHDYPLCWRCKTPLLMIAQPQWFLKISEIHQKLLDENDKINWVPEYMKLRMKAWLEGISDWPISRERYWGTPLPIWRSDDGDEIVIGSIDELKKLSGKSKVDLHKPEIDKIIIEKSGKKFKRVSEVLDVWFDSGVSSWAALGYPKNKEKFDKFWPADLNLEGKDQFRGWWNSQLILSVLGFDKKPFDSIFVHGMVLNMAKTKMSKSKGNVVDPKEIISKYSRDFLRYYFAKLSKGEDISFNENEFRDIQNVFRVLVNVNTFVSQINKKEGELKIEDKWIMSKFNSLINEVNTGLNKYRFYEVLNKLENFMINDLSRTYIQIVRDRADETYEVLNEIRVGLIKMFAPFVPFMTEGLWRDLKEKKVVQEESVHLSSWPKYDGTKVDGELEKEFETANQVIEKGLFERDKNKVGLRWPLAKAEVFSQKEIRKDLHEIIKKQLNIKAVEMKKSEENEIKVSLDLKPSPELEAEGFAREIARRIQAERKKRGLKKSDNIGLKIYVEQELRQKLDTFSNFLKDRTGSKDIEFTDDKSAGMIDFKIKEKMISFTF